MGVNPADFFSMQSLSVTADRDYQRWKMNSNSTTGRVIQDTESFIENTLATRIKTPAANDRAYRRTA